MKNFLLILLFGALMVSCARVGAPVGGKKDTIPPKFLGANIDTARTNVPRDIRELRLDFDEYIALKDINKNLIVSPPIKKIKRILPGNLASKYILIQWEDTLKANTTYSFNFGNAIADNNEGNILPYFNYAFSTGDKIDNLYISGEVKDALTGKAKKNDGKEKNIVVGLYRQKDTMNYRQKPDYITKADPDGYYELNYLSPGDYRILAIEDDNQNSLYDNGKENIGFLKEPVHLDKSISGLNLKIYPSRKPVRYKEIKAVNGGIEILYEGNPENVSIRPLTKPEDYKVTHRAKSDTVNLWFDPAKENLAGNSSTQLKFVADNGIKKDTLSLYYKQNPKEAFSLGNNGGNTIAPGTDFVITANQPVVKADFSRWKLESDSTRVNFTGKISDKNPFTVAVKADFLPGKKYSLTVPKESVSSYYQSISKSYRFDFGIEREINLGNFTLHLKNASPHKRFVQFLNDKDEVQFSRYTADTDLAFNNIKPGSYTLRILEDEDDNGTWDEADFAKGIFAEPVYLFPKKIDIKPMWDASETWDLKAENEIQNPK